MMTYIGNQHHKNMMMNTVSFILAASLTFSHPVSALSNGNEGCECIDSTSVLDLISDCFVETNNIGPNTDIFEARGVTVNNVCYPLSYGANQCATHDMNIDPVCQGSDPPAFCLNAWCYVNATECHTSEETFYKTDLFSQKVTRTSTGVDEGSAVANKLYYSYSTCNSTAEDWRVFATTAPLSERPLVAVIPGIVAGDHYKLDSNGELVDWDGTEAFDNSIPWQGWLVDYITTIVNEFSNIPGITFIHRSRGSKGKAPTSSWTQAVTDVEAGIADVGVAAFWITSERLGWTPFTIPIALDPIYLWIKQPEVDEGTLRENVEKLLSPFSNDLWLLLMAAIVVYALISMFLSPERFRVFENRPDDPLYIRARNGALMMADSLNISFLEFLGGNVDYWTVSCEAQKILNVGFALTVFVSIAAYTANLAAFLTRANATSYISNMEEAIAQNVPICTWSSLQPDAESVHPMANWKYLDNDADIFEAYDRGDCSVILRGYTEVPGSQYLQESFCKRNLVHLEQPVLEKTMGWPVSNELVGGISYWISQAANKGITVDSFLSQQRLQCPLEIQIEERDSVDELAQLTPTNMALPLIVFVVCVVLSVCWQICENHFEKRDSLPPEEAARQRESAALQRESVSNLRRKSVSGFRETMVPGLDPNYQCRASLQRSRRESYMSLRTRNSFMERTERIEESEQAERIAKLEENLQLLLTTQKDFIESMKLAAGKEADVLMDL